MPLEEAVLRGLVTARRVAILVHCLVVVLIKNYRKLDPDLLVREAKERRLEPEMGMFLDLTAKLGRQPRYAKAARKLRPREGPPRYFFRHLHGPYEAQAAELRTPPIARRWGFRMNMTEADLRGFVNKHMGWHRRATRHSSRGPARIPSRA